MKKYLSANKNISKIVIVLIAIASVLSISITCLILREVITKNEKEIIKVIAAEVNK